MDPAHVFRQGLGSVAPRRNHHQALNFPSRQPLPHDDLSDQGDGPGGRIAHTLTACCRCRQVIMAPLALALASSCYPACAADRPNSRAPQADARARTYVCAEHCKLILLRHYRERRDATRLSPGVSHASGPGLSANISIRPRAARSIATMSSSSRIRSGRSRLSSLSMSMTRVTTLTIPRIWLDPEAWFDSVPEMRPPGIWVLAVVLP